VEGKETKKGKQWQQKRYSEAGRECSYCSRQEAEKRTAREMRGGEEMQVWTGR